MLATDKAQGQGTVARHAATDRSDFHTGLRPYFEYRDTGIAQGTAGDFTAHVIRAVPGRQPDTSWHTHEVDFQMTYVMKGWIVFEFEDIGIVRMVPGSSCYQPSLIRHRVLANSDDLEMLEIISPAEFTTALA
jgi:mannose-6-phosphate isomerase-like protein (cupin superfamily)